MKTPELKKIRLYIIITTIGFTSSIIGLITDLSTFFSSAWYQKIVSSKIMMLIPYLISFLLLCLVIYEFNVLKRKTKEIGNYFNLRNKHWERMVRTLRAIILVNLKTPSIKDALDPILDELSKRLPEYGLNFKMSIAVPYENGSFKIIASRGMDPASIQIERRGQHRLRRPAARHVDSREAIRIRWSRTCRPPPQTRRW